ncbi:ubiquitin carboxyl-terminal hydrolase 48-like isoform X2 [Oscarella lobularis]|uniref:ubiquitin carboxyl-terminal hydrolase 48-like isoform X2 n=1 Tax=Oscarella lobularis TaxID=121494 RepID=UPI0033137EE3
MSRKSAEKRWDWAKNTAVEDIKQRHVDIAYGTTIPACKPNSCNRKGTNCKGNPNCLQSIGEKFWLGNIKETHWLSIPDTTVEEREKDSFVGLKNLGATCYMNTLLQLWFHTPAFRAAIYSWSFNPERVAERSDDVAVEKKVEEDVTTSASSTVEQAQDDDRLPEEPPLSIAEFPGSSEVCGQLQLIFSLLEYSSRRYIDPSSIVSTLGLDRNVQQDAQEFSKLFMSLLETKLSQECPSGNVFREQFGGKYSYVTTCSVCRNESSRSSQFYELDLSIQNNHVLQECIQDFLQEEKLEGDDQYYCSWCCQKQNASRRIVVESLPPILNIQLLRFVFDRATFKKKKLSSYLQFPQELDMSPYTDVTDPSTSFVYNLTAVLTHQGPSAYSGHYIAYLYKKEMDSWWSFNDETVVKLAGKKLNLATHESEYGAVRSRNPPRLLNGHQMSSGAYMLVYTRKPKWEQNEVVDLTSLSSPPAHLSELVALDNSRFEQWATELRQKATERVARGQAMQKQKCDLYQKLTCLERTNEWEWINLAWLKAWLSKDLAKGPGEISHGDVLCPHGRVDPLKCVQLKRIRAEAAAELYGIYGGSPRLCGDIRYCVTCVRRQCRKIQLKDQLQVDHRLITSLAKAPCTSASGFWIGKYSLRSWNKIWEEKQRIEEEKDLDEEVAATKQSEEPAEIQENAQCSESEFEFNHDLLCKEHGQFTAKESARRLVSAELWRKLKEYFPEAPEFSALHPPCVDCLADEEEKERMKETAAEAKAQLLDLYHGRNRPEIASGDDRCFVVSAVAINAWRRFVRYPTHWPSALDNSPLICDHGRLMFDVESKAGIRQDRYSVVTVKEWTDFRGLHTSCECVIEVWRDESSGSLKSLPEPCEPCIAVECDSQMEQELQYDNVTVSVLKVNDLDAIEFPPSSNVYDFDDDWRSEVYSLDEGNDPDAKPPNKKLKLGENFAPRRSGRRHCRSGEVKILVSSRMTLKDLKLKVMNKFLVLPSDQTLSLNGKELIENDVTLEKLGIRPNVTILLKVDKINDEVEILADNTVETGFKGTGLLGQ